MAQLLCLSENGRGPDDAVDSPLPFDPTDPDTSEDEDRFFAGLTRRLTQSKSFAGVPSWRLDAPLYLAEEHHEGKSTLAGTGTGTGTGTSHFLTPMGVSQFRVPLPSENERFDLAIRAAALELASLKMAQQEQQQQQQQQQQRLLGTRYSEKRASPFALPPDQDRFTLTQNQNPVTPSTMVHQRWHAGEEALFMGQRRTWMAEGRRFCRTHSFPEPEWASKADPYGNRFVPKRGCAGTGVFLPRGYGDIAPESRRKSVIVPAKVARALNMNVQLQDPSGLLLARRNALLMQERRLMSDGSLNHHRHHHHHHEPCLLPQEWTY